MKPQSKIRYLTLLLAWMLLLGVFQTRLAMPASASPLTEPANRITNDLQQVNRFIMIGDEDSSIFLPLIRQGSSSSDPGGSDPGDPDDSDPDDNDTSGTASETVWRKWRCRHS